MRERENCGVSNSPHMKRIDVDTNFNWLGPDYPVLSHAKVSRYELQVGERVLTCQDDDEWEAVVRYDATLPEQYEWYVALEPAES